MSLVITIQQAMISPCMFNLGFQVSSITLLISIKLQMSLQFRLHSATSCSHMGRDRKGLCPQTCLCLERNYPTQQDLCYTDTIIFQLTLLSSPTSVPEVVPQLQRTLCAWWSFLEYLLRAVDSSLALHQTNVFCYQVALTLGTKWRCSPKCSVVHQRWLTSCFLQGAEIWRRAVQHIRK